MDVFRLGCVDVGGVVLYCGVLSVNVCDCHAWSGVCGGGRCGFAGNGWLAEVIVAWYWVDAVRFLQKDYVRWMLLVLDVVCKGRFLLSETSAVPLPDCDLLCLLSVSIHCLLVIRFECVCGVVAEIVLVGYIPGLGCGPMLELQLGLWGGVIVLFLVLFVVFRRAAWWDLGGLEV